MFDVQRNSSRKSYSALYSYSSGTYESVVLDMVSYIKGNFSQTRTPCTFKSIA